MEDKEIIDLYWHRSESAIEHTRQKYGNACYRIAQNILSNHEDSEECVNDTYLNAWNSIPPHRPEKLGAYLYKITRNLALNRFEKYTAQKRGGGEVALALEELEDCLCVSGSVEECVEGRILTDKLNVFLSQLPSQTRKIFLMRYWNLSPVKEISDKLGVTQSKVKMSLLRTRMKLKGFLEDEGVVL